MSDPITPDLDDDDIDLDGVDDVEPVDPSTVQDGSAELGDGR